MALPIKLTAGGRVITKVVNGVTRISCECCAGTPSDCCMYPIDKLNILYTEEDWPEEGIMFSNYINELDGPRLLQKNIGPANRFPGDSTIRIYGSNPFMIYYYPETTDEYVGRAGEIDPGLGLCLFGDPNDPEDQPTGGFGNNDIWFYDNFKDSYTAQCSNGTFTLVREELCVWRSRNGNGDVNGELFYRTRASAQDAANNGMGRILWRFNNSFRTDAGPYNSPAGEYGDCSVA